jgi:hypothetical protein
MTQPQSKARQQAELAFAKTQSQFFARNRVVDELDAITKARREKTLRLKMAREAKELEDRARSAAARLPQRVVKA